MATELSQDAVLLFIRSSGGSVKNSELLLHFRSFIRDHADRDRNREMFKKFVNTLATVRQEDGVSHVVLRKRFRGHGSVAPENTHLSPAEVRAEKPRNQAQLREAAVPAPPGETTMKTILPAAGIINNNNMETNPSLKRKHQQQQQQEQHQLPPEQQEPEQQPEQQQQTPPLLLLQQQVKFSPEPPPLPPLPPLPPAAAVPLHLHLHPSEGPRLKTPAGSEPLARLHGTEPGQQTLGFGPPPGITPVRGREACVQPGGGGGLHQEPPPPHPHVIPRRFRYRQSYRSAVSHDEEEEEEEEEEETMRRRSAGGVWPLTAPLEGSVRALSASSPCIIESPPSGAAPPSSSSSPPSSSERILPKIYIHDVEVGARPPPHGPALSCEPGAGLKAEGVGTGVGHVSPEMTPIRSSQPEESCQDPERRPPRLEPRDPHSQGALLSPGSVFSPSSDGGFSSSELPASGSPRGSWWNSSYEAPAGDIEDMLQRAQRTKPESHATGGRVSPFHLSTEHLHDNQGVKLRGLPWYLSTGDLYDGREEAESSDGSSLSSPVRRLSGQARSRMCRSLGADLDQILQEEERGGAGSDAARLNRLQLISSSLSLCHNLSSSSLSSCSTPLRSHSVADLVGGEESSGGRRSLPAVTAAPPSQHAASSKQSLVPLEPREHAWLVKGAAASWPDVYSLFRDEPSLLNKRDFISGFTVLHWISKHGDHRVLNTLWYGVQKAGLMFDVNARSTCGHTPLHIAAIHGNKNIMRLLVGKFDADVRLRDTAGKKPWQYLSCSAPLDIFQLLGAPARVALGGDGPGGKVDSSWEQQQQQHRRRRRHHFSTASSGERPLTVAGTVRVKRSSSIAALLKHKSLRRFHARKSDFLF